MSRILVVFYSRTGTVREVARRLANLVGADLEEIVDPTPRAGVLGFLRSAFEARRRRSPPIAKSQRDPAAYDLVVLGSPVWAMSLSAPVRAWVRRHKGALRDVAAFCCCGGSGSAPLFAELGEELGRDPIARLVVREEELRTVNADLTIERFAERIRPAPALGARLAAPARGSEARPMT